MIIEGIIKDHNNCVEKTITVNKDLIIQLADKVYNCLINGNKILLFGNGGSAADAQHISAEFVGRFLKERKALPAIALTTDSSAITAIANDYGYDQVFKRQVDALAIKGDIAIGITTSGNSKNVILGLESAKKNGCLTVVFSGGDGGLLKKSCDINIIAQSSVTARIQEVHILIGHILCAMVDELV